MLSRLGAYIAYVKDSEQITDLLAYMGAGNCAMEIMGTKALKQVRNSANRLANSEIANLEKTAAASANQLKAIRILKETGRFNLLSDELKEVANLREEYPELSNTITVMLPDEKTRRVGQSVAAASLPEVK